MQQDTLSDVSAAVKAKSKEVGHLKSESTIKSLERLFYAALLEFLGIVSRHTYELDEYGHPLFDMGYT